MDSIYILTIFSFVTMAVFITATTGMSLSGTIRGETGDTQHYEKRLSGLLRLARDVNDAMDVNETTLAPFPCTITLDCWHYRFMEVLTQILMFDFIGFTQSLDSLCIEVNATSCVDDTCTMESMKGLVTLGMNVLQWGCNRKEDFQNGMTCWADPFRNTMVQQCEIAIVETSNAHEFFTGISHCFDTVIQSLPDCTDENHRLFTEFAKYVMEQHYNYYE